MPTLKSLVDETSNIKNELVNCYDNLKTNLSNKDITLTGEEKLFNLISKINEISTSTTVVISDNFFLKINIDEYDTGVYGSSYKDRVLYTSCFQGSIRFETTARSTHSSYDAYLKFQHIRGGAVIAQSNEFKLTKGTWNPVTCSYDFSGIKVGDILKIQTKVGGTASNAYVALTNIYAKGDIVK